MIVGSKSKVVEIPFEDVFPVDGKTPKMAGTKIVKKVPPDGGWGWVIVFAFAMSNIVAIPVLQNFGLLFRNIFVELNFTATDVSTIINVNSAAGLFVGLFNGPLLKKFGYRKFALLGASLMFAGFLVTGFATTMWEFIIFYGIINSIGINILISSFSLALNSYFLKKRSIASGFSSTLTGLGPVFMPLLISKSIEWNSARGTALLLSGLLLHSIMAAMLLQPVKWHQKIEIEEEELEPLKEDDSNKENGRVLTIDLDKAKGSTLDLDQEALDLEPSTPSHILEGVTYPRRVSIVEQLGRRDLSQSRISLYDRNVVVEPDTKWWNSKESIKENRCMRRRRTLTSDCEESATPDILMTGDKSEEVEAKKKGCWQRIVKMFDLDLLKDPVYFNIWLGMSIAFTGEINFSLMTPVILGDRNFDISETAKIMSTIATADIIFRFVSPFIGNYLKLPPRQMYMISLVMLATTRFSLTCVTSYYHTLIVAVGLGVAKGFRTVYMSLVIPNHVPLEKLASASGLQTVLNGLFLFTFGPVVGVLRDVFGTYDVIIHLTNIMSLVTVTMWSIEMLIVWQHKKSKS
uniref:Monocarboxylate transporter 1 n=2 Tax=Lygus hesperus TaxID=30085 RepID=A0A146L297_LYGHE